MKKFISLSKLYLFLVYVASFFCPSTFASLRDAARSSSDAFTNKSPDQKDEKLPGEFTSDALRKATTGFDFYYCPEFIKTSCSKSDSLISVHSQTSSESIVFVEENKHNKLPKKVAESDSEKKNEDKQLGLPEIQMEFSELNKEIFKKLDETFRSEVRIQIPDGIIPRINKVVRNGQIIEFECDSENNLLVRIAKTLFTFKIADLFHKDICFNANERVICLAKLRKNDDEDFTVECQLGPAEIFFHRYFGLEME